MFRDRRNVVGCLLVALLTSAACSVADRARNLAEQLSDDRLIPPPDAQAFFTAARRGDVDGIRKGLAGGLDVNLAEPLYGRTALMRAASFDHAPAVGALLEAGADVHATDLEGYSALHVAAAAGAVAAIPMLVKAGAGINAAREPDQVTPLAIAVQSERVDAVRVLLAHGARPDLTSPGEITPIEQAIRMAHPQLVAALIQGKASLVPSKGAQLGAASLLHLALDNVQKQDTDVIVLLLKAGADQRTRDERGRTPFERIEDLRRAGFPDHADALLGTFRAAGVTR
jgi:hypothetical protein